MIDKEILKVLTPITDEERAILAGTGGVDKSLYTDVDGSIMYLQKKLAQKSLITVRKHTRFIEFPEHIHDYVEAVYMCAGSTVHVINGKELVLQEGEILFLGQGARQRIMPAGENDIAVNFIIQPSFFNNTLQMLGAEDTPIKNLLLSVLFGGKEQGYLHFKVSKILPVQNLIENLIWTLVNNSPNKISINQNTMALLFMQLLNHTDKLVYHSKEDAAVMELLRYIEENYKDGSLKDAAKALHYDFYWLSHEIKNRTGRTYTEHLQEKRLSQAEFLLKNTQLSVEDVALSVGYENKSYFHRIFCAKFGQSPKKYRDKKN